MFPVCTKTTAFHCFDERAPFFWRLLHLPVRAVPQSCSRPDLPGVVSLARRAFVVRVHHKVIVVLVVCLRSYRVPSGNFIAVEALGSACRIFCAIPCWYCAASRLCLWTIAALPSSSNLVLCFVRPPCQLVAPSCLQRLF